MEGRAWQRTHLVLLSLEVRACARHEIGRDAETAGELPGLHQIEIGLGRLVPEHCEQIVVAIRSSPPLGGGWAQLPAVGC